MTNRILPYEMTAPMAQPSEVEVYLGEGIWWRLSRGKAMRLGALPTRRVRHD
jgi:hypothetical protein